MRACPVSFQQMVTSTGFVPCKFAAGIRSWMKSKQVGQLDYNFREHGFQEPVSGISMKPGIGFFGGECCGLPLQAGFWRIPIFSNPIFPIPSSGRYIGCGNAGGDGALPRCSEMWRTGFAGGIPYFPVFRLFQV